MRGFLEEALTLIGFHGIILESGAEALAWLDGEGATSPPAIVVMDLTIPGENGVETLRKLRARLPETPIINAVFAEDADGAYAMVQLGALPATEMRLECP